MAKFKTAIILFRTAYARALRTMQPAVEWVSAAVSAGRKAAGMRR